MAKERIDVTKINGYDEMTAEEKVKALEGYEIDVKEPDLTGYVKKELLDKATSDASNWKHKFTETLNESERKAQELAEQQEADRKELTELRRDRDISQLTTKFQGIGYDEALARATAIAQIDGDTDTVLANQKTYINGLMAKQKDTKQKETPAPPMDNSKKGTKAKKDMSLAEMQDLYNAEGKEAFEN